VTVNGAQTWQPSSQAGSYGSYWGWQRLALDTPYVNYTTAVTSSGTCYNNQQWYVLGYSNYLYYDAFGTAHPFPGVGGAQMMSPGGYGCPPPSTSGQTTGTAGDGSGYSISFAVVGSSSGNVSTSSGTTTSLPFLTSPPLGSSPYSATDANGNEITFSNGAFTDTLGTTALTVTGAQPNPMKFTYTGPAGSVFYQVNFSPYNIKTAFLCTNPTIQDYTSTGSVYLPSSIVLPDGSQYSFSYEPTPGNSSYTTGRVSQVTLPTGGTISYSYSGSNDGINCSDGSTLGLQRSLSPGGTWQYSRSGSGTAWTTTVTDPTTPTHNQTVIDFQEDSATTNPSNNFYETQRQVYQGLQSGGTLLLTTVRCYNNLLSNCTTTAVQSPITQLDAYRQLPNGSTRLSATFYNGYGLVKDDKEYNYGVTLGTAPSVSYLVRETAVSYANLGNGIVNKPSSVTVSDWTSGSAVTLASSTYFYDQTTPTATSGTPQHIAITGSRGNLTTATTSTSSTASLSRTYTYYDTGNPYVATDVNNAQTTYLYGSGSCGNSFATTINEPLSLSRSITWNCTGGIATQVTDENGKTVTSNYTDPDFWRPANVVDQLSNQTNLSYIRQSGQNAVEASLQNFNGGNSVSDSRTTMDGFGRPILSQRLQGPGATNYDTVETDYNNVGQPSRFTMPFSAAAGTTNSSAPGINTTYDALGRALTSTDANGGTVSYTYTNNDVLQTVSGTQTFQKQLEYDGLGRLASVCEISSTLPGVGTCTQSSAKTGLWTKYTYDALGHLLAVTQNAQATAGSRQARSFVYDMLGRITSESNPETGQSGTNGTVTYTWDAISPCGDGTNHVFAGDLVQKKDNAGNITCYSYDGLHRIASEGNTSVSNTILRKFFYDSKTSYPSGVNVSNGKTHMVEAQTFNSSNLNAFLTDEFFSYSARGEVTDLYESTPHSGSGVYYHTTASFWPTGSLKSLSGIPGVPTINYGANGTGLDGEGRYTQVTASSGTSPVSNVTYSTTSSPNPLGALTGVSLGSADSDTFTYDANTGRIATYTFSVNTQTDTGTLTWNTNGTLQKLAIVDHIPGTVDSQTCNYQYDDLQRISSSLCGSIWAQNFTYDSFGNITKSGSSAFAPSYTFSNGAATNQFFSIPGVSVSYDKNGNLLTDNLNSYTWDPNWGNMLAVTTGSTTVTATYDALGRMIENNAGGTYTEFIYAPTGAKVASVHGTTLVKALIALPGGAKAVYNSSGLAYYRHSDWLGSSRLTSTATAPTMAYSSSAYAPFGEQYAQSGALDASFTRQDSSTLSSLYDFPFRESSPSQGRWISPDPLGRRAVALANPQTWNRYAYVANNPLSLTDPLGLLIAPCDGYGDWYCGDDDGGSGGNPGAGDGIGWLLDDGGVPGISGGGGGGGSGAGHSGKGGNPSNAANNDPCGPQTWDLGNGVTIQSDAQGTATATVQLTGSDVYSQTYGTGMGTGMITISPNTSLTIGLQSNGAMSLSLNNPLYVVGAGTVGAYISSATYDINSAPYNNAGFTQVNGATSIAGIPLGSWNTPSSFLLDNLNQNSALDNMAQAAQAAMTGIQTFVDLIRLLNDCAGSH
jgi:RHS repeat-associated protein